MPDEDKNFGGSLFLDFRKRSIALVFVVYQFSW